MNRQTKDKFGNFDVDGHVYLERCTQPECGLENYASNISSGICSWCGFDANADKRGKDEIDD